MEQTTQNNQPAPGADEAVPALNSSESIESPADAAPFQEDPLPLPANGVAQEDPLDAQTDEVPDTVQSPQSDSPDVMGRLRSIAKTTDKLSLEMHEIRKLYHNEFAGRLQAMQEELNCYHEMERGRAFDELLRGIAKLYSDNQSIVDLVENEKTHKQLRHMFLDIAELLQGYGVHMQKSNPGDKRNPRFCQVIERRTTDDPDKHDTVVKSHRTGFYVENRALLKEMVDVYLYTK